MQQLDGARDFDFEIGNWHLRHRRLKLRLQDCHEWEEFSGHCAMQPSLDGYGNLEQNIIEIPGGTYHAIAIRAFDPNSGTWAIWWLDARDPHHLDKPVIRRCWCAFYGSTRRLQRRVGSRRCRSMTARPGKPTG